MKSRDSESLLALTAAVGDALRREGIRGVVTGGSCASLHCDGVCTSRDIDVVLSGSVSRQSVDAALAKVGFSRRFDRYVRPDTPIYVEFPRGPLAVGGDLDVRPVELRVGRARFLALSATDSCRDRLAQFFHWNDRQGLAVAVLIATRRRVALARIATWAETEGFPEKFGEFRRAVQKERKVRTVRRRP